MTIMHNAPTTEELLKIEGIVRVERLTKTRIRLHFKGDNAIVGRVVKQAVENQWHLREISLERNPWIRYLQNCLAKRCDGS